MNFDFIEIFNSLLSNKLKDYIPENSQFTYIVFSSHSRTRMDYACKSTYLRLCSSVLTYSVGTDMMLLWDICSVFSMYIIYCIFHVLTWLNSIYLKMIIRSNLCPLLLHISFHTHAWSVESGIWWVGEKCRERRE